MRLITGPGTHHSLAQPPLLQDVFRLSPINPQALTTIFVGFDWRSGTRGWRLRFSVLHVMRVTWGSHLILDHNLSQPGVSVSAVSAGRSHGELAPRVISRSGLAIALELTLLWD